MKRYIIRRFLLGIVVVWIVSVLIFGATRIGPDPALMIAAPGADEAELNDIRDRFGLNEPLPVQYYIFIKKALRADFGESVYYGLPVSEILWQRLPASVMLVGAATRHRPRLRHLGRRLGGPEAHGIHQQFPALVFLSSACPCPTSGSPCCLSSFFP